MNISLYEKFKYLGVLLCVGIAVAFAWAYVAGVALAVFAFLSH